jgi:CRISPR-associated protein Csb2
MLAIDLQFLAGRFHATPWGSSPNEGVPEWPPSPWRLARALVSTALGKAQGTVDEDTLIRLCHVLAAPPLFHLPPATVGHARHYLPLYGHDATRGITKSALVFDTFVAVDARETVTLVWSDLTLPDDDLRLLDLLLARLDYLGRSESWVRASARQGGPFDDVNCAPLEDTTPTDDWNIVRLLCPTSSCTLKQLSVETSDVQRARRPLPEGATEVAYLRDPDCFALRPRRVAPDLTDQPELAVFLLDGPVLPRVQETILVADLFRKAAIHKHQTSSLQLSGKDEAGIPVHGHHHMYVLPTDEDDDGLLDHVLVFVRGGMAPDTLDALAAVRRLYRRDQSFAVVYLGSGEPRDMDSPSTATSTVWESATPFVPTRHTKFTGSGTKRRVVDTLEEQLILECVRGGLPPLSAPPVLLAGAVIHGSPRPWYDFVAVRGGHVPTGTPAGYRLTFTEPVHGPLSLGGQAHFGLGRFVAVVAGR